MSVDAGHELANALYYLTVCLAPVVRALYKPCKFQLITTLQLCSTVKRTTLSCYIFSPLVFLAPRSLRVIDSPIVHITSVRQAFWIQHNMTLHMDVNDFRNKAHVSLLLLSCALIQPVYQNGFLKMGHLFAKNIFLPGRHPWKCQQWQNFFFVCVLVFAIKTRRVKCYCALGA